MTQHTPQKIRHHVSRPALVAFAYAVTAVLATSAPASAQDPAQAPQSQALPTQPTVRWAPGEKGKVKGAIMLRQGDEMLVRQESSNDVSAVTLTDGTKIQMPTGLFNIDKKRQDVSMLAPGLFIEVHGVGGDHGNLVATRISFHKSAVKVQNAIAAGEVELRARQAATAAQAQANLDAITAATARARDSLASISNRIDNLDKYTVMFTTSVLFPSGKFELTDDSRQTLDQIVANGQGLTGYVFQVTGHTDNVGSVALNQALSARRTNSVVNYLVSKGIPLQKIQTPTGMGESDTVGSNDSPAGRAANRRVEVRVLQNKGLSENGDKK